MIDYKEYEKVCAKRFNLIIKAKIKGLQEESRILLSKIHKCSGDARHELRRTRKFLGDDTRHHLLAYALLRKKNYSKLERKCGSNNKPNVKYIYDIIKHNCTYSEAKNWSEDRIEKLISGESI